MTGYNWKRIEDLFSKAIDLEKDERIDFLKKECGEDIQIFNEVLSLLESDENIHPLLAKKASDLINVEQKINFIGQQIGSYRIIEEIASGGMGTVFLAERSDGLFEQKVALKIIKPGLSTIPIIRRFQQERQVLANLQHANIARLFDGGVTEDKRPFFTMEFVDGTPIDQYCDDKKLSIKKRLELFIKVCEAVQYAHNNLVIHRDLKPSNILIQDDGSPKLLDFGISKVLSAEGENLDMPTITQAEINLLTPEYSSPEQFRKQNISVSTDVYSLGLILYKLLVGRSAHEFSASTFSEYEQVVCEKSIAKPSSVLTRSDNEKTAGICNNRSVQENKLKKIISGDLDNICMMALRKDPNRRYASVEMLAYDIERYLNDLPILARRESFLYASRKFIARHKKAVAAAVIGFFVFNGLILFYTFQLKMEKDKAEREARKSEQIASFLQNLFLVSDPSESKGESITARELLDRGANSLQRSLEDDPEVKSQLLNTIGNIYTNLGLFNSAEDILRNIKDSESKNFIERETYIESLLALARLYRIEGKYDEAKEILDEAYRTASENLNSDHPLLGENYLSLGGYYYETGNYEDSYSYFHKAENMFRKKYGNMNEKVAGAMYNRGTLEFDRGNVNRTDSLYRAALNILINIKGELDTEVAEFQNGLGWILRHKGEYEESKEYYERALNTRIKLLGKDHPDVAHTLNHMARLYYNQGLFDKAEPIARDALQIRLNVFKEDHPEVTASRGSLASILFQKGNFVESEAIYRKAYLLSLNKMGENHPYTAAMKGNVGRVLMELGEYKEAEKYLLRSFELVTEIFDKNNRYVTARVNWISDLYIRTGRYSEADIMLRSQIELLENEGHTNTSVFGESKSLLGYCLFKQSKDLEAEGMLVTGYNMIKEHENTNNWDLKRSLSRILEFYNSRGRVDKVREYSSFQ
jgi:serine/threonine-protein kinase